MKLTARMSMGLVVALLLAIPAMAVESPSADIPPEVTLISNVNVFDGIHEKLIENANVVVTGNLITAVSTEHLAVAGGRVIDGGGRTLMPGLIDAHWHTYYAYAPQSVLFTGDMSEVAIIGFLGTEKTLMRGFTTVRDVGGNPFAVKKMTDSGEYPGPRVFPSGPPISQTSGHLQSTATFLKRFFRPATVLERISISKRRHHDDTNLC